MQRRIKPILVACVACAAVGYQLRVLADGAPAGPALFYSGTLERDGALASGSYEIALSLYSAAEGGEQLCKVEAVTEVDNGRFRIEATACESALRANASAWAEVAFTGDDGETRTLEDRTKIGAVPYALEADRAISAQNAEGALDARLNALSARLDAIDSATTLVGFQAVATQPQSIPFDPITYVIFDRQVYDTANVYDEETGIFTASAAGDYEFTCTLRWDVPSGVIAKWEANLHLNDQNVFINGGIGEGQDAVSTVHGVMKLEAGDRVRCGAWQSSGSNHSLFPERSWTNFEGHRIGK